jgi:PKD repeat protein
MKKNTILLLVSVTLGVVVTLGGVFVVKKFPQLVQNVKKNPTTVTEQYDKEAVSSVTTPEENVILDDELKEILQQAEDAGSIPTQPDPVHVTRYPSVGVGDSAVDNVQDYVPDKRRQPKKQVVLNKAPISVEGGASFSDGIMVNSVRAMNGVTFSSDGKMGDWRFGDGTTATGKQVKHAYGEKGSYNVIFLAEANGTIYITKTKIIVGGVIPMFVVEDFTPRVNELVTLDGSDSMSVVGSITNYKWSCAETQASQCVFSNQMGQQGALQFTEPGIYEVALTTTNNIGISETEKRIFSVSGEKPIAKIVSIQSTEKLHHPAEYEFDASGSVNVLGETKGISYEWDFDGDGEWDEKTTDPIVQYEYTQSGEKTVRLRVEYKEGKQEYVSEIVTESISDVSTLWVDFEVPYVLVEDESFLFHAQSQEGVEYVWEADKEESLIGDVEDTSDKNISFHSTGIHSVTLTGTLNEETTSITKSVAVRSKDMPMALLQYSIDKGDSWENASAMVSIARNERGNTNVLIRASAVDGMGAIGCENANLNYSWSVRGVPVSTECDVGLLLNKHFSNAEIYPVQLTVYTPGDQNQSDQTSLLIEVENKNPEFKEPISYKINQGDMILPTGPVDFLVTAYAEDTDTDTPISQYFFEPIENGEVLPDTQLLDMGQAYFDFSQYRNGVREISFRVTATDSDGGRTISQGTEAFVFENNNQSRNEPPVIADFTVSETGVMKGELVRFDVIAQDTENDILTYKWIVSQGGIVLFSREVAESFLLYPFEEVGTYAVGVKVSDGLHIVSSESQRMISVR